MKYLPENKEAFFDYISQTKDPEIRAAFNLIMDVMRLPGAQQKYNNWLVANTPAPKTRKGKE